MFWEKPGVTQRRSDIVHLDLFKLMKCVLSLLGDVDLAFLFQVKKEILVTSGRLAPMENLVRIRGPRDFKRVLQIARLRTARRVKYNCTGPETGARV